MKRTIFLSIALLLFFALLSQFILHLTGIDKTWLEQEVLNQGARSSVVFIFLMAGLLAVGLPRQLVALLAGYGFGLWQGFVLASLATVLGCGISYFVARCFLSVWIKRKYRHSYLKYRYLFSNHVFKLTFAIRLLPAGSNVLTSLIAGALRLPAVTFVFASGLGYLPQNLIFVLMGNGVQVSSGWQILMAVVGVFVALWLSRSLLKELRARLAMA